jgi:acetyl esterase/lipase
MFSGLKRLALISWLLIGLAGLARTEEKKDEPKRIRDVIYGRKFGMALTLDVFQPSRPNGAAVIWVISGGWFSSAEAINPLMSAELLKRGYTVFAVVHGSQPKFTIPEIADDMHRAIRFIRTKAKEYNIDANRLGITGISAGGHLSMLMGTSGSPGDPKARDPIDRESSKVQAVACFCPPTDFLHYGGKEMLSRSFQPPFTAACDYHEYDVKKALYVAITDEMKQREIARKISPITYVSASSAPARIFHGDKDKLVPIQQAESMVAKLKEAGVPAELVVRKGADHVWPTLFLDFILCADWFDKHLAKPKDEK